MKKHDIIALGELLIDFTENGISSQGNPILEANPGGAPGNLLAMCAKLGDFTALISRVGDDNLGHMLCNTLKEAGVDNTFVSLDSEIPTTLAFVHKKPDGDRDFSFYRNPGADMMLSVNDIPEEAISLAGAFHFGTLSMTHNTNREATLKALDIAKNKGLLISFDPNLREPLWNSLEDAKEAVLTGLKYCDFLKISDNEIQWLSGEEDFDAGIDWIKTHYPDIKLITLTLGKDGSKAYYKNEVIFKEAFVNESIADTTGAGDTFGGCMLHFILKYGIDNLNSQLLGDILTFANMAASIITTKKGALKVMATREEILARLPEGFSI